MIWLEANSMLNKKTLFLFLAFVLPIGIFLFLRFFGRNEFSVQPLYVNVHPEVMEGCPAVVNLPYAISDSIMLQLPLDSKDLVVLKFGDPDTESANQLERIEEQFSIDPVAVVVMPAAIRSDYWRRCVFFLKEPYDLVLIDRSGVIRGQYNSSEREEMDRLITELSIILKKY
jgi:hypothetical protein